MPCNTVVDNRNHLLRVLWYSVGMEKEKNALRGHLRDKRNELIFALLEPNQGYSYADIGAMFNMNRSTVMRIAKAKPKNYKPKWIKSE